MKIDMPQGAKKILDTLEQNGFEAFVVGGCVRDSLLGNKPNDWDITTSALPEEIAACFSKQTLVLNGLRHGTVGIVEDGVLFEATTYRVDGTYSDNRRPDSVTFTRRLEEDLCRRDFTVNAMAYNDLTGVIDSFGGMEDLGKRLIRCVGEPKKRFEEDALRILRALRFSSKLDFSIEEQTARAVLEDKDRLKNIAMERIAKELLALLCGEGAGRVLREFPQVFFVFLPELAPMLGFNQNTPYHDLPLWKHTVKSVESIAPQTDLRLVMLLHDIGKPSCKTTDEQGVSHYHGHPRKSAAMARQILTRLRLPTGLNEEVVRLVLYHDYRCEPSARAVRRLLNKVGEDTAKKLVQIRLADANAQSDYRREEKLRLIAAYESKLDEVLARGDCFSLKDMQLNGKDLISAGFSAGKEMGSVLQALLEEVIDGRLENRKALLLARAKELYRDKD